MPKKIVSFNLNGRETDVMVSPMTTVQTVLREHLAYTATKSGCKQGGCGSCTILVNGEPMMACLLPIENVAGMEVTTLEGLTPQDGLSPLQESFYEKFATQCGYCTPGMIVTSKALLDRKSDPSREEIIEALTGNFCRCTGYEPIIRAVQDAVKRTNGKQE
ncbi:MAG TPA: (2Fe-2S)-binding protein [Chloroflexi bacterium]|nr:(2Fe-2S)-binding protein [Chloroflexota bacterium]